MEYRYMEVLTVIPDESLRELYVTLRADHRADQEVDDSREQYDQQHDLCFRLPLHAHYNDAREQNYRYATVDGLVLKHRKGVRLP